MDSNLNKYAQYLPFASHNGELYSNAPGDFINSEDLRQHLPPVMEMINKVDGLGSNPFPERISSLQSNQLQSMPQTMNVQNKVPGEIMAGNNIAARMPEKEVLMEPCTVSQPMNASLRKGYSKGIFYFLEQQIQDFGK